MSQARPSRRSALVAGAATAALCIAGPMVSGCAAPAPEGPDPLEAPARRAEADAALALTMAGLHATMAPAARALAADRRAHARMLNAELLRVHPSPTPVAIPTSPAPSPQVSPDPAAARSALIQAIHAAQDEAAALVLTLPGYRAALLASVSACCATHAALLS